MLELVCFYYKSIIFRHILVTKKSKYDIGFGNEFEITYRNENTKERIYSVP